MFREVENQGKQSLGRLKIQKFDIEIKHAYDERFMYGAEMVKFNKSLQGKKSALSKLLCKTRAHQ